jgi:hypothetical protein
LGVFPQENQYEDQENGATNTNCGDKLQHLTLLYTSRFSAGRDPMISF